MRNRHLSCVIAALIVTPALVVLPVDQPAATADSTPVPTTEQRVALVDPKTPAAGDAQVATTRDLHLAKTQVVEAGISSAKVAALEVLEVSEPQDVPSDLAVIGVTYGTSPGPQTVAQYRSRTAGGAWEAWQAVDSDPEESDPKSLEGTAAEQRAGSDPIVLTGASQVQMRVMGPAGAGRLDARLSIIDPGTAPSDSQVGTTAAGQAHAAARMPLIHSRKEWGANESWRKEPPSYTSVKGVVVHHTAGTNNYTQAQVPAILRGIYAFHTKDRGWNDIAYNVLVDKWGRMWEGRAGGLSRGVMGAHASGWNTNTMGVSVLGDYNKTAVSSAAVRGVEQVIAWKAGVHGFDPDGYTTLNGLRRPVIQGHRDVGQTSCPGTSLYAKLGQIRRDSAQLAGTRASTGGGGGSVSVSTKPTGGLAVGDVLMRSSSGKLMRSRAVGQTDVTFAVSVSSQNWSSYDQVMSAGDLTGDGRGDILARQRTTGRLYVFPGNASGGVSTGRSLGSGWNGYGRMSAGGDLTGDGKPDLLVVNSRTGQLFLFHGNGKGSFGKRTLVGGGWGGMRQIVVVGDWDGDRRGDVLGVQRDGTTRIYRGNGRGGFLGTTRLATNFKGWGTLAGMPGQRVLLGLDSAGNGTMIRRYGTSTVRTTKVTPNFRGLTVFGG